MILFKVKEYNHSSFVEDIVKLAGRKDIKKIMVSFSCNYKIYSSIPEVKYIFILQPRKVMIRRKILPIQKWSVNNFQGAINHIIETLLYCDIVSILMIMSKSLFNIRMKFIFHSISILILTFKIRTCALFFYSDCHITSYIVCFDFFHLSMLTTMNKNTIFSQDSLPVLSSFLHKY